MNVYVTIGNSDDKLPQEKWSAFVGSVTNLVANGATKIHGVWLSEPSSPYQNACWGFEVDGIVGVRMQRALKHLAHRYGQDSIVWAEASVKFLWAEEQVP